MLMYRVKMAISIAAMLIFVLALGATLLWGTQKSDYFFKRSEYSHEVLDAYQQLSVETDRFFHEHLSIIALSPAKYSLSNDHSYRRVQVALDNLKQVIQAEINFLISTAGHEGESARIKQLENSRLEELEGFLEEGLRLSIKAHQLKQSGKSQEAYLLMEEVFFEIITDKFWPVIDIAVQSEMDQAHAASMQESATIAQQRSIAIIVSILAIVAAISIGLLLYLRLTRPINGLIEGTEKYAAGELTHRVEVISQDEFGKLAKQFNNMADALYKQHTELMDSRANLEIQVKERTKELHDAYRRLKAIDKSRRQFFADISHELRTPLTIIRGEAEVTLRGREKPVSEYTGALKRITELTGQMGKLVEDLLYLARAGAVEMQYEPDEVELNELVQQCHHDAQSLAQEKRLSISLYVADAELYVIGDRIRLRQLLHILIDNACHYSKQHGTVELKLEQGGQNAIISITDNGIGIPEEDLERVFERFYRTKSAQDKSEHGTGLGLPLAKAIAETHNGSIKLVSKKDEGTTAIVSLPLTNE